MLNVDRVYVVHVKSGYEERGEHITRELSGRGIPFQFMLDGDIPDIRPSHLDTYFGGPMHAVFPAASCALKHFLIYEEIVARDIPLTLVLEDDAVLAPGFAAVFNESVAELRKLQGGSERAIIVSYENSTLRYVPQSRISERTRLYAADRGRCAGAYVLTREAAATILREAKTHKCSLPVDLYHNELIRQGLLQIFWCHPPIVEQGSHSGLFASAIDGKKSGVLRKVSWGLQKFYKRAVLNLFR